MGFWDVVMRSIGEKLTGITPDLSTMKRAAYDRSSAAVAKVDQAVRSVDANQYLPSDENRAQIGLFTTTLAKNVGKHVVQEGYKHIPGATVAVKLVSDTMSEMKRENNKDGFKSVQAKMDRSEEDLKKSISQREIPSQNKNLSTHDGDGKCGGSREIFEQQCKIISKI
ncbi:hypothetical protein OSB04_015450 [Centaurea solstitialis]|uniref:Uncharacterized protein n=1 Tax=Centaurea solstitialis TaxID=347529 RepID=A0AA38WGJ8_9ASTR|nr:hypothetical protein OSB04_015450 [Centaurea solstitialis]